MRLPGLKRLIWPILFCASFAMGIPVGVRAARQDVAAILRQRPAAHRQITDIHLDDPTLGQLMNAVGARLPSAIRVDWPALRDEQGTPDTPLQGHAVARIHRASIGSLLNCFMDKYHSPPKTGIQAIEGDGVFTVTTLDAAAPTPSVICAYDVADILAAMNFWKRRIPSEFEDPLGSRSGSYFGFPDMRPEHFIVRVLLDGEIRFEGNDVVKMAGDQLIVVATPQRQTEVRRKLGEMRQWMADSERPQYGSRRSHLSFEHDPQDYPLRALDFRGTSIGSAIEKLRRQTGLNIVVDWPELHRWGIEPDAIVTRALPEGRLGEVVRWLCGNETSNQLVVGSSEGMVLVSDLDRLAPSLETTRFYPFDDAPVHHALLGRIERVAKVKRWPGWIVVTGDHPIQSAVADLLKGY